MAKSLEFTVEPTGPFDLLHQNQYFNGWPRLTGTSDTIVMAFPVEGCSGAAAVTLQQTGPIVRGAAYAQPGVDPRQARDQGLAAISLDQDGSGWPAVGHRDEVIGALQTKYRMMRPTMFHSPYEAAAAFVIGHRSSIAQTRIVRAKIADEFGARIPVGDETVAAFPAPFRLLALTGYPGLSSTKIDRLHAVARAAQTGRLDRAHLRSITEAEALAELQTIDGIGPFFAQGILYRGAGRTDGLLTDDMTMAAIRRAYGLGVDTPVAELVELAEKWRPYRGWVTVLLHLAAREAGELENPRSRK
jgi:DNA-3-methyladenine glycosylase II